MEHERKLVVQISKVSGRSIHVVARLYLLRLALITGSVTLAGWTAGSPGAEPALTEAWVVIFQERVQSATLSHDGRLLAVTREPAPRISLVEVASGKVTASFEEWPFSAARWHPWKPLLAIGGGDAKSERYFLLDAQTGRSQEVMKTGVDVFCWAEDGEHLIIGQALYLDIRNRKALSRHPPWRPQKLVERLYRLMDGPKGYLAAEILREYRLPAWPSAPRRLERDLKPPRPEDWPRPKPPEQQPEPKPAPESPPPYLWDRKIIICKKLPGKIQGMNTAVRGPARSPAGAITSFPTQASFLADGRVAYVRVCMEGDSPSGKREVWIANPDGSVAKKWLDLPGLGVGNTSGDSFTVSRDGRTIAYIWQGKAYVQRVQPPK